EHRLGKVAGSDLGLQLRLDVGVLDLRSVVGGRRSDGEPPGEAPAADGLVGARGLAAQVRVVLGQPVEVGRVGDAGVETAHGGRRAPRGLGQVGAGAVDDLN